MSIPFSSTTNKNGLIQLIERILSFNDGDISGNPTLLAQFTADINLTIDEVFGFLFPLGGTWQLDDSNQTDYPIITTSLVSGQRDYSFTTDQQGNVILDIYRVLVANSAGVYSDITPVDQQTGSDSDTNSFVNGANVGGIPTKYDKTANGIFLDPIPNYNYSAGLRVFINREGSYFTVSDTTKKVGFAHLFHEYFAIVPAQKYARSHGLSVAGGIMRNGARTGLLMEIQDMRRAIIDYYGTRQKDKVARLVANTEDNH